MEAPYDLLERDGTTVSRIDIVDGARNRKPCYCYRVCLKVSLILVILLTVFFILSQHPLKTCSI